MVMNKVYLLLDFLFVRFLEAKVLLRDLLSFLFYLTVPLGSIQELPAESCSEIKASEGNEMVNRDYWIYSDENTKTILARCEGTAF